MIRGQPQQLLPFRGRTLLRNAVETALETLCRPIIVVLGAYAERVEPEIHDLPVIIARNDNWQQGMGTAIRCGIQAIFRAERKEVLPTDGCILTLCDQPFVTAPFLQHLANRDGLGGKEIVAAQYNGIDGAPVFFSRTLYAELLAVAPNKGTRELIQQFPEKLHGIPYAGAGLNADMPEDDQSFSMVLGMERSAAIQTERTR
jgi:molybdenum cofactor cytidylyltransferase